MATARFFISTFRQNLAISRSFRTSAAVYNDAEKPFRSLPDRFRGKNREDVQPTRLIKIAALPQTSTSEDIRKLAREAFHKGDKSVSEIIFCRRNNLSFNGDCVVLMNTPEDAQRLISYGDRRSLGGHILKMSYVPQSAHSIEGYLSSLRKPQLKSSDDRTQASGSSVIISGFPLRGTDNLLGYLRSKNFFPLDGVSDNVSLIHHRKNSPINRFLVKFDSESEAWRCVRTFHNSKYTLNRTGEIHNIQVDVVY